MRCRKKNLIPVFHPIYGLSPHNLTVQYKPIGSLAKTYKPEVRKHLKRGLNKPKKIRQAIQTSDNITNPPSKYTIQLIIWHLQNPNNTNETMIPTFYDLEAIQIRGNTIEKRIEKALKIGLTTLEELTAALSKPNHVWPQKDIEEKIQEDEQLQQLQQKQMKNKYSRGKL